jgi:Hep_Hag./Haemagglutinin.
VKFHIFITTNYKGVAMPVLPIATVNSLGGVKLDPLKDIQTDAGTISTKYNGLLNFENKSVVVGDGAQGSSLCVAIGRLAKTGTGEAIAIGRFSQSLGTRSVAVGGGSDGHPNVSAAAGCSVALGYGTEVSKDNSVALGYESAADESYVVSVGKLPITRRIVNVTDGVDSNDAVTFGQFKRTLKDHGIQQAQQITTLQQRIEALEHQLALLLEQKR